MKSEIDTAARSLDIELDAREAREARSAPASFRAGVACQCWRLGLRSYCVFDESGTLITGGEVK